MQSGESLEAYVDLVETMGSETHLYLSANGNSLTAKVAPHTTARLGENLLVALDMEKIHLFDQETQKVI
jgi:multiple sugar transport system ATP-binding protein